jgi:hypothetical protein
MALAFAERTSSYSTTNATSYATGTLFTPAASSLMLAFVFPSSTDAVEAQPTSVSGNSVTYTQCTTTVFVSGVGSGSAWVGIVGGSPTNGAVTASGWGTARTGIGMSVFEITGADVSGTALNALASAFTATGTATSGSVTMTGGPLSAGNLAAGFFDHTAAENISAGANCAVGSTGNYATPNRGMGSVYNNTATYGNPAASWTTSAAFRALGVEVKVAAAVGGATTKRLAALGAG